MCLLSHEAGSYFTSAKWKEVGGGMEGEKGIRRGERMLMKVCQVKGVILNLEKNNGVHMRKKTQHSLFEFRS